MSILQSISDFVANATGTPITDSQRGAMNGDLYSNMIRAGATPEQAAAAVKEQNDFADKYWPPRSIPQTVADIATGDPNGVNDYKQPDILNIAIIGLILVLLFIAMMRS